MHNLANMPVNNVYDMIYEQLASESRLEQESLKMLMKETKIPESRKTNEKPEEKRVAEKGLIAEKDTFDRKEEMESEAEPMEVDVMDKRGYNVKSQSLFGIDPKFFYFLRVGPVPKVSFP
jgi:hypothetical protein